MATYDIASWVDMSDEMQDEVGGNAGMRAGGWGWAVMLIPPKGLFILIYT
jgi:hypothetical protein